MKITCNILDCIALRRQIRKLEAERSFLAHQAASLDLNLRYGDSRIIPTVEKVKLAKAYENDAIEYALPDDEE